MSEKNNALRIACATMLSGESYLEGALVLGYSLRRSGWKDETLALVTPDISGAAREKLSQFWDRVEEVEHITNPHPREEFGLPVYATLFTKLRIWEFEEYSRLIYIDSDAIVLGSLDALRRGPAFAAAPCMWTPDDFNAGVLAIEPSRAVFADMVSKIGSTPSHDGSDQGFLNNYFSGWFSGPSEQRLPAVYNLQQYHFYYAAAWNRLRPNLRILHYTGHKPWRVRSRFLLPWLRFAIQRFSHAPRDTPIPFEIWHDLYGEMKRSQTK
jgi:glycogenin glucosyltransferase